jgi:hypothetical protein
MKITERLGDSLSVLFGLKRAVGVPDSTSNEPVRFGSPPETSGDDISLINNASLFFKSYCHLEPDRQSIMNDIDEMFLHILISSAMEAYVEDALQEDIRTGEIVTVTSPNPQVKALVQKMFDKIELTDRISGDLWNLGKYGDYFNVLLYNKQGIFDSRPIEARICHRHEDFKRVLRGFTIGDQSEADTANRGDSCRWKPWDMIHWRLRRYRPLDPYGTPFFINCRLIYKVLKLCEEQMAIYRMQMSPDRFLYKVFCGSQSPDERMRTIRKWHKALHKTVSISHSSSKMISEYQPWAIDGDFIFPIGANEQNTGVEKMPGSSNTGDLLDVLLLRDYLFAGTRVPKGYMGFEDSQGYRSSDTLSQQSIKFVRGVKRLRRPLLQGYTRMAKIHLALQGIDSSQPQNSFELSMTPINYLEECQRAEYSAKRFEAVSMMMNVGQMIGGSLPINNKVWATYVLQEFAGFDDATINKLLTPMTDAAPQITFSKQGGTLNYQSISKEEREIIDEAYKSNPKLKDIVENVVKYETLLSNSKRDAVASTNGKIDIDEKAIEKGYDESLLEAAAMKDADCRSKVESDSKERIKKMRDELKVIAEKAQQEWNKDGV